MKKRERLEVIRDILNSIKIRHNSIRKTPLIRASNLSTKGFNEYYSELLKKNFIKEVEDKNGKIFVTLTDKGFKYLDKYNMILSFMDDFGL